MIELIYNEEEGIVSEEAVLPEPKNVKQIGTPKEYKKIFIEDFVHLYLLQYGENREVHEKIAVLLGNSKRQGGRRHLYIKSAFPIEGIREKEGKYEFSERIWGNIYQECEKLFPEQEILGWFLAKPGLELEKNQVMETTHRTYFSGADKVLFVLEPMEGENTFFAFDGNRFSDQKGYYIYYEKNDRMRDFIIKKKHPEKEQTDVAVANFRKILKEKQEQRTKRKKRVLSYGAKVGILMLAFVGMVALQNRMEVNLSESQDSILMEEMIDASTEAVLIEELSGDVEMEEVLPVIEEVEEEPEITEEIQEESERVMEYTVQAGDTLAKISREFYGTDERISEICSFNGIPDGDYIQVGEIILLP